MKTNGQKNEKPEYHFGWRSSGMVSRSKETDYNIEESLDDSINLGVLDNSPSKDLTEQDLNANIYEDPFTTKSMTRLPHPKELFGKQRKAKKRSHRHISSFDSHIQLIHQKQAKIVAMNQLSKPVSNEETTVSTLQLTESNTKPKQVTEE